MLTAPSSSSPLVLDHIVASLDRAQCLRILNDPRVSTEALQRAMAAIGHTAFVATPAIAVSPQAMAAAAPKATPAVAAAPKVPKAPKAAPAVAAAPAAAIAPTGIPPMEAIKGFVGQGLGFAAGDIAKVCGLDARDSSIRTAFKNALAAAIIVSAGEKRFTRYGATAEVAQAASLAAAGK